MRDMTIVGKDTTVCPCVATIGSFDGVHRGHRFVMEQVVGQARERGLDALVVTFRNHPLQVLREGFRPQMLTLAEEKVELLQEAGIDKVVLLEFTQELARMSARKFMQHILKEQLKVEVLVMGYDNHFGHGQTSFKEYAEYGRELGIEVVAAPPMPTDGGVPVSSTAVRKALLQGEVEEANGILGYHYFLQGEVVEGFQNGRRLGYPTANLQVDEWKLIPENGAYLVECTSYIVHRTYGMLNIGTRPTLHNGKRRSIEVHLFDFEDDLYGQTLRIRLIRRLRGEQEFGSLDALRQQLEEDEAACRAWISHGIET